MAQKIDLFPVNKIYFTKGISGILSSNKVPYIGLPNKVCAENKHRKTLWSQFYLKFGSKSQFTSYIQLCDLFDVLMSVE